MENGHPKNKYMASIDPPHLYFVPGTEMFLDDITAMVVIVESEKAAMAVASAAQRAGRKVLPIGTGGCWGWRGRIGKTTDERGARVDETGVLPDFELVTWTEREVVILFDGNATTNPSIKAARWALAKELR